MTSLFDFSAPLLDGRPQSLAAYRGRVVMVVNVASKCGNTPQYSGLEAMWRKHRDDGLTILGFPCNQFGDQEPGTAQEIADFCSLTYDVSFPMFGKIEVNGPGADPLYKWLKQQARSNPEMEDVRWNFEKFLIDRDGAVVARVGDKVLPEQMEPQVAELLDA